MSSIRAGATRVLTLLFVLAAALTGCGGGNVGTQGFSADSGAVSPTSTTSGGGTTQTATLVVTQTLATATASAQPVPVTVVSYRFTGTNSAGAQVFGPTTVAKAATVTLTVPVTMTNLRIEYLDATGTVLFIYTQAVTLTANATVTITDPAFQAAPTPSPTPTPSPSPSPGAAATKLSFTVQPSSFKTGASISPAIQVAVQDANGGTVTTSTAAVTLAIGTNPSGAALTGTTTANAVNGVATFTGIGLDKPGNTYTLVASSANLTSATSNAFKCVRNLSLAAPVVTTGITGSHPSGQQCATGDFNKDGKDDIVTADATNNQILVLISDGTGNVTKTAYAASTGSALVAVADLDGDGNKDVVATCSAGVLSFFRGKGDGTFFAKVDYNNANAGGSFGGVCIGDFDADGKLDVVVTDSNAQKLTLFLNTGNFTFAATNYDPNNGFGAEAITGVAAGDFNGDGTLDVAIAQFGKQKMYVWKNAGGNNVANLFPSANLSLTQYGDPNSTSGAFGITVADLDGSGKPDIALACLNVINGKLSTWVFFNNGDGTFATPKTFEIGDDPFNIFTADFNLDGIVDLGLTTTFGVIPSGKGDAEVLLNNGDQTFQPMLSVQMTGAELQLRGGATGDFNGDGLPDIVGESDGDTIGVFLNTSH